MVERTDAGQVGTLRVIALCLHFLLGTLVVLFGQHRDGHGLGEDHRLREGKNVLIDPVETDGKREGEAEEQRQQRHGPVHHLRAASVCALLGLHGLRLIGELAGQLHREHLRQEADDRDDGVQNDIGNRGHATENRHVALADEVVPDEHRGHREVEPDEVEVRQVGECGQRIAHALRNLRNHADLVDLADILKRDGSIADGVADLPGELDDGVLAHLTDVGQRVADNLIQNDDEDHLNQQRQASAERAGVFLLLEFHQFLLHFLLGGTIGAPGIFLFDDSLFRAERCHLDLILLLLDAERDENHLDQNRKQQQRQRIRLRKAVKEAHDIRKGDIDKFHVQTAAYAASFPCLSLFFVVFPIRLFGVGTESFVGHRVIAAAPIRVAAEDAVHGENQPAEKAAFLKRLNGVGRTGRTEPATTPLMRGNILSIQLDEPDAEVFHRRPVLRSAYLRSRSMSCVFLPTMPSRATMTTRCPVFTGVAVSMLL